MTLAELYPPLPCDKMHYTVSGGRALTNNHHLNATGSGNANQSSNGSTRNHAMFMSSPSTTLDDYSGVSGHQYPQQQQQPLFPLVNSDGSSSRTSRTVEARSDTGGPWSQLLPSQRSINTNINGSTTSSNGGGRSTTTGSVVRSVTTQASGTANAPTAPSTNPMDDSNGEFVFEEKRRRPDGDGYSVHQYLRGRLLGKGGFAKVYLCTALDTGKNYAVKVVTKANLVKARARQKLQAEIKIHRALKHKHICQYKHYFEDRNNCYILLELCTNQSLNEMIKRRKRLTEPEAAYFMVQLLDAVRYMHQESVIHRDLKLGNLFLDRDMQIKVGDFGLATRVEDRDEKRKTICGTPNYIAPEIIQGDKHKRGHSFEVDIWSMGVILYTVLVGKPPYEAKDVKATYQRILANEYSFPTNIPLSSEVKDLIVSMLKSDPKERPSLDYIESHPFLVDNWVPENLPHAALHREPNWQKDEFGALICDDKPSTDANTNSKPLLPRLPFGSYNPNMPKPSHQQQQTAHYSDPKADVVKQSRETIDFPGVVKSAISMATGLTKKSASSPAFQIFDESKTSDTPSEVGGARSTFSVTPRSGLLSADTIIKRTKELTIASSTPRVPASSESVTVCNPERDVEILRSMLDHLDDVIAVAASRKGSYSTFSPLPSATRTGPSNWVSRYVDYTSKYGLGFLLNSGGSGVHFNDSTKIAMEANGEKFHYIERKRDDSQQFSARRAEHIVEVFSLSAYPDHLKKKVTLLTHFRNYLIEQQMKAAEEDPRERLSTNSADEANGDNFNELIYLKKWLQTKHAILFRLSNNTLQVVFYDQTEILLTPDTRYVTYVDKSRCRLTYALNDELVGTSVEIEKRLKYTKEIVGQLLWGVRG